MIQKIVMITGPSGVGKASIEKILFERTELNLAFSCSATTRAPRKGEIDGMHYHFLTKEKFEEYIDHDEFIEYSKHFENYYGTLKSEIKKIQEMDKVPLIEVETNGAVQIMGEFPEDELISIFISPPSNEDLEKRIKKRNTENLTQLKQRLKRAEKEIKYSSSFKHIVINDDLERAANEVSKIIMKGCQ